ncbi:MAG: class I SAM-dependent methyltransferase [Bacteroidota bacterium]
MNQADIKQIPELYPQLVEKCQSIGFTMPSDIYIGTLLKSLVASKPQGRFLELGTGIGLSLVWMIEGLDAHSTLISIDNDKELIAIATAYFGQNQQVELVSVDGGKWLDHYQGEPFDILFADAWPGKYSHLDKALSLVKVGGFYIIDDMKPQPNWPEGHAEKADQLLEYLESLENFVLTKMDWSTGVVLMTKIK